VYVGNPHVGCNPSRVAVNCDVDIGLDCASMRQDICSQILLDYCLCCFKVIWRHHRTYFYLIDAKGVKHPRDLDPLLNCEGDTRMLLAFPQSAVEDPYLPIWFI